MVPIEPSISVGSFISSLLQDYQFDSFPIEAILNCTFFQDVKYKDYEQYIDYPSSQHLSSQQERNDDLNRIPTPLQRTSMNQDSNRPQCTISLFGKFPKTQKLLFATHVKWTKMRQFANIVLHSVINRMS
jgi:hypothetical protein